MSEAIAPIPPPIPPPLPPSARAIARTGPSSTAEAAARIATQAASVVRHVEQNIMGKHDVVRRLLTALTAGGHVLLLDVPGVGKTALAKAMAFAVDLEFRRVQFTPDLLPLDVTGSQVLDLKTKELHFARGPVFTNVLLADEINRAPAKTQAALLEAMAEGQVTADGTTHPLPNPFLVVATMNPLDHDGTYALPQAQLDRFAVRLRMGFPDADAEMRMLDRHLVDGGKEKRAAPALSRAAFCEWQTCVGLVHVADKLKRIAVDVVSSMRADTACLEPPSPRATLMWMRVAMAHALLSGRDHVIPEDLRDVAGDVLGHRILLERNRSPQAYIDERLGRVLDAKGHA